MSYLDKVFKTRREKFLFYITLTLVIGALLLVWIILPAMDRWFVLTQKLNRKKSDLAKVDLLIKDESKIMEEYNRYQKGIQLQDPQKRPEDTLLLQADELQKESNIRFTRMDPVMIRKIPKMPGYQSFSLQAGFEADLLTVGRFLEGVQIRGLYIDYLQLVPKSKSAKNPILVTTIRIGKVISKEE